jgi:hypothetical protein
MLDSGIDLAGFPLTPPDLFEWAANRPPASVHDRCQDARDTACIKIYAEDMATVVRAARCVVWCPLLREPIE